MAAINSEDEAAAWAHRNLPAKNTLTAADAKIVEERFQARLCTISDERGSWRAVVRALQGRLVVWSLAGHLPIPLMLSRTKA